MVRPLFYSCCTVVSNTRVYTNSFVGKFTVAVALSTTVKLGLYSLLETRVDKLVSQTFEKDGRAPVVTVECNQEETEEGPHQCT